MVLPKKKTAVPRKKVLSLQDSNSSNNSPPRSLWQSKYESLLPEEKKSSSPSLQIKSASKGLSALAGNYNSDSDSESEKIDSELNAFKDEINKLEQLPETSNSGNSNSLGANNVAGTSWIPCYDQNSGYPYYWNQATNEVSWQPPAEYVAALQMAKLAAAKPAVTAAQVSAKKVEKPKKKTYPWQTGSDSEDEKIEMITSFGPDDGSQTKRPLVTKKSKTRTKVTKVIDDVAVAGPQLPRGLDEHHDKYETSSLMTPLVRDEGPPGVEGPSYSLQSSDRIRKFAGDPEESSDGSGDDDVDVLEKLRSKAKLLQDKITVVKKDPTKPECHVANDAEKDDEDDFDADAILAEIEKEIPPDIVDVVMAQPVVVTEKPTNSFALIASYGDDSDTDEVPEPVSSPPKLLFPSMVEPDSSAPVISTKPLFPSASEEESPERLVDKVSEIPSSTTVAILQTEATETDEMALKAFKRKKRIEISRPAVCDSVPEANIETERSSSPVSTSNPRYNMDPTAGVRTGFGFMSSSTEAKSKSQPIQFVKSETIQFQRAMSPALGPDVPTQSSSALNQDLIDGAALLREKLAFLGEGKAEVSAIQIMAIQLETLFSAWQSGSLTPEYLCQWLGNRAVELLKNEQAAAPPGWICEWDREKKRYSYRNETTRAKVWDYPEAENSSTEVPEVVQDSQAAIEEVEMEMSTPPRLSPSPVPPTSDDNDDVDPTPPPPPLISRTVTPPPPPPPTLSTSTKGRKTSNYPGFTPPLPTDAYPKPPDEPLPPGVEDLDLPARPPLPSSAWVAPPPPPPETYIQSSEYVIVKTASGKTEQIPVKRKLSLVSELDSFYSDLAKLDEVEAPLDAEPSVGGHPGATTQPPLPSAPFPPLAQPSPPQSPCISSQEPPKKKKKSKLTPGLTLKKKGVSSLVAKWQQVREDAKRSNSDDEDDR